MRAGFFLSAKRFFKLRTLAIAFAALAVAFFFTATMVFGVKFPYQGASAAVVGTGTQETSETTELDANDDVFWNITAASTGVANTTVFYDNFEGWATPNDCNQGTPPVGAWTLCLDTADTFIRGNTSAPSNGTQKLVLYDWDSDNFPGSEGLFFCADLRPYSRAWVVFDSRGSGLDAGEYGNLSVNHTGNATFTRVFTESGDDAAWAMANNVSITSYISAYTCVGLSAFMNLATEVWNVDDFKVIGESAINFQVNANMTSQDITQDRGTLVLLRVQLAFNFNVTSSTKWYVDIFNVSGSVFENIENGTLSTTETIVNVSKRLAIPDYIDAATNGNVLVRLRTDSDSAVFKASIDHFNVTVQNNTEPQQTAPSLVSSSGNDQDADDLWCYNQSTSDADNDTVTNIYNWYKNSESMTRLYLPFDTFNDSVTRDHSGALRNGSLAGGIQWNESGKVGGAYIFDGVNDQVNLTMYNTSLTSNRTEVTVSFWIMPYGPWSTANAIWDECVSTQFWQFSIYESQWYTRDASTGLTGARDNDLTFQPLVNYTWHYFTAVYSVSQSLKAIYINGSLHNSTSTSVDQLTTNRNITTLGGECNGSYFFGVIDELQVWNSSLSAQQIAQIYNDTKNGFSDNRTLVSQETSIGDQFICEVTPTDSFQGGTGSNSSALTVLAPSTVSAFRIGTVNAPNENVSITTFPGNNTNDLWFNATTLEAKYVQPCVGVTAGPPVDCQDKNNGVPIFNVTNAGNILLNITIVLNETLPSGIVLFANFSNATSPFTGTLADNDSIIPQAPSGPLLFANGLGIFNSTFVFLFANFTGIRGGNITLNVLNYSSNNTA